MGGYFSKDVPNNLLDSINKELPYDIKKLIYKEYSKDKCNNCGEVLTIVSISFDSTEIYYTLNRLPKYRSPQGVVGVYHFNAKFPLREKESFFNFYCCYKLQKRINCRTNRDSYLYQYGKFLINSCINNALEKDPIKNIVLSSRKDFADVISNYYGSNINYPSLSFSKYSYLVFLCATKFTVSKLDINKCSEDFLSTHYYSLNHF